MNPTDRQRKKRVLQRRIRRNGNHDSFASAKLKRMQDEERKEQMRKRYARLGVGIT